MNYDEINYNTEQDDSLGIKEPADSRSYLRRRKFLMVLPIIILPFILLLFIALGGGKGSLDQPTDGTVNHGLNMKLPDPHFKKAAVEDKLTIYETAHIDSLHFREAVKNDPYYKRTDTLNALEKSQNALEGIFEKTASRHSQPEGLLNYLNSKDSIDQNEKKLLERLSQLKREIAKKPQPAQPDLSSNTNQANPGNIEKLEKLAASLNSSKEADTEMTQLNGMLEKIIAIQHPEAREDSIKSVSRKNNQKVFVVDVKAEADNFSILTQEESDPQTIEPREGRSDSGKPAYRQNAFYSIGDDRNYQIKNHHGIEAVIDETKTIIPGATIKLRLLNDIFVGGVFIPRDLFVFGKTALSNDRLRITIHSIQYESGIFPVSLDVYDLDGLEGINMPGNLSRDVSRQSADQALGSIGLATLDPSIGAQATSAGIQAAKTLLSRKVKLLRLNLKAGYKLLLKNKAD